MKAVMQLRRTADVVEAETSRRVRVAQRALMSWSGPQAEVFVDELRRRVREADDLAAACRRAASQLEAAAAQAAGVQAAAVQAAAVQAAAPARP